MLFIFIQTFYLFWITVQGELISLEHCSSRNRRILRQIVHTLKSLAWLSRIIKRKTPKLVSQARLQQLWSDHELSKIICVEVVIKGLSDRSIRKLLQYKSIVLIYFFTEGLSTLLPVMLIKLLLQIVGKVKANFVCVKIKTREKSTRGFMSAYDNIFEVAK